MPNFNLYVAFRKKYPPDRCPKLRSIANLPSYLMLGVFYRIMAKVAKSEFDRLTIDSLILMRVYHPRPVRCVTCCVFHHFHTKVGQFLLILLCRRPLCKLDDFLLLSINDSMETFV